MSVRSSRSGVIEIWPVCIAARSVPSGGLCLAPLKAIQKYGFKAIVAENFAEIFFGNCTTLGIPCLSARREDIAILSAAVQSNPEIEVTLDLARQEIRFGSQRIGATLRDSARDALVNGRWDAIGELLEGRTAVAERAKTLPYLAA